MSLNITRTITKNEFLLSQPREIVTNTEFLGVKIKFENSVREIIFENCKFVQVIIDLPATDVSIRFKECIIGRVFFEAYNPSAIYNKLHFYRCVMRKTINVNMMFKKIVFTESSIHNLIFENTNKTSVLEDLFINDCIIDDFYSDRHFRYPLKSSLAVEIRSTIIRRIFDIKVIAPYFYNIRKNNFELYTILGKDHFFISNQDGIYYWSSNGAKLTLEDLRNKLELLNAYYSTYDWGHPIDLSIVDDIANNKNLRTYVDSYTRLIEEHPSSKLIG